MALWEVSLPQPDGIAEWAAGCQALAAGIRRGGLCPYGGNSDSDAALKTVSLHSSLVRPRHGIDKTTLPNCSRFSRRLWASAARSSGRTVSITGFSRPRLKSSSTEYSSDLLPINEPRIESCREKT